MKSKTIVALLLLLGAIVGCKSSPKAIPPALPVATATVAPPSYVGDGFHPGDNLMVSFTNFPDQKAPLEFTRIIKENGTIKLLSGQVFVADGKTTSQLEEEVHDYYVPKFFPNLTVRVLRFPCTRFYYVGGAVNSPGRQVYVGRKIYDDEGSVTVFDAIQQAGGFTRSAKAKKVRITRANEKVDILDCRNPSVCTNSVYEIGPGDKITVPPPFW